MTGDEMRAAAKELQRHNAEWSCDGFELRKG